MTATMQHPMAYVAEGNIRLQWRDRCDTGEHIRWALASAIPRSLPAGSTDAEERALTALHLATAEAISTCPVTDVAAAQAHVDALPDPVRAVLAPARAAGLGPVEGPCACRMGRWFALSRSVRALIEETLVEYWIIDTPDGAPIGQMGEPGDLTSLLWSAFSLTVTESNRLPAALTIVWDGSVLTVDCDPGRALVVNGAGRAQRAVLRGLSAAQGALAWALADTGDETEEGARAAVAAREVAALPDGLAEAAAHLLAKPLVRIVSITELENELTGPRARRTVDALVAAHALLTTRQWTVLVALAAQSWSGTLEELVTTACAVDTPARSPQ